MAQPETFSYGSHELQEIHVYKAQNSPEDKDLLWVIYIHGGAWRDNTVLADSFSTTQTLLSKDPLIQKHVAAFASIDYRLSPHPNAHQDPNNTPKTQLRDAKHPEHIHDVQTALAFLQDKYGFGDRYILVGHSCGATLSFQVVMNKVQGANATTFPKPKAIAGVCGIYDLKLLRNDYRHIKIYEDFIKGAFGSDEELWDGVSPGKVTSADGVASGWENGRVAVLASSTGDLLINQPQLDAMLEVLKHWQTLAQGRDLVEINDLKEEHDDVWGKCEELACVIITTVQRLSEKSA
ncbi:conserved hypothetical protein [Talaromyces stipitatus ATCC 10500]|uniref:Kynurenine formamidase n=1 Tax=Talaromyces stipitatus (strain ATCC 10500 / CBS 375.48 / QM 6759 / NRRL 1006) TaxID=441959 RepID=B8LUV4_TALSN|nr:uncharacterized protein TSTA_074270 [Talaromyces stipitatus ATCC 10500]EED24046.1 conserved hypothetical protein [Talaromyces stipitatus ATCC 10500]